MCICVEVYVYYFSLYCIYTCFECIVYSEDVRMQLVDFEHLHRSSELIDISSRWNECVPVLNQLQDRIKMLVR